MKVRRVLAMLSGATLASSALGAEPWEGAWVYDPGQVLKCGADSEAEPFEVFGEMSGVVITQDAERSGYWQSTPEGGEQTLQGGEGAILGHQGGEDFWECRIGKITDVSTLQAWIFDVHCGGEGSIWEGRTIFMRTAHPGELAAYNLGWEAEEPTTAGVTQLYRCQSSSSP